jgi:hypothetical protein
MQQETTAGALWRAGGPWAGVESYCRKLIDYIH